MFVKKTLSLTAVYRKSEQIKILKLKGLSVRCVCVFRSPGFGSSVGLIAPDETHSD